MRPLLRLFLIGLFLISGFSAGATKLYWVGGSGNFNDPAHWSYQSGGQGGAKTPTITDDVFFDDNSFFAPSVINFIGATEVHDLTFSKYAGKVTFFGLQNEVIIISGDLALNSYIDNQFKGDIRLVSSQPSTQIYFSLATCKGNVYFDGNTNWVLKGNVITDDNSSVYLKQGNFNLTNAGIYTGNLTVTNGVTLNTQNTNLKAKNKLVIPAGVTVNDGGQSRISAYIKDPSKYQVAPGINFNNARYGDLNSIMACSVVNTAISQPTCAGACNGTITFTVPLACTSNPVYAVWSTGGGCTAVPTGTVAPGATYTAGGICGCGTQYSVIFTNDPNTQDSTYEQFNISIADPIPARVNGFTLIQPSCFGYCDGQVIANLNTFGQLPILSNWTSSTFTGTVTHTITTLGKKDSLKNSCAGTYTVQLVDANGCVSTPSVTTLNQPTQVVATPTSNSLACNGVCTGSITETVVGGTPGAGYTYTWTAPGGTVTSTTNTSTYSNLCAGTYTFITADSRNCRDTNTVTIIQPPPITFVRVPPTGAATIACNNTCNGTVGVNTVAGGTAPYSFSWLPAGGTVVSGATSSTYSGLCGSPAGITYTCTITDANNCPVTATFTVTSPPALSNTITPTQPLCVAGQGSAVGSATVTESGGVAPYTFTWSPGGNQSTVSPSSIYSNLSPGTYTVSIRDGNGCLDTASVTINAPTPVSGTITTTIDPTCPSQSNGQLCVTAGGGAGGFTYTWTPIGGNASCTPTTLTVTPGGISVYTVNISDVNSCTVAVTGTLTAPPQATFNSSVTHPPCSGVCNGTATLTPSGGIGPFTYQWSCSASVTSTINGQCGGTTCNYTVTDAGTSCRATGSVSFTVAPTLSVTVSATALPCSYSCNSVITTTVAGGTPNYTYSWTGTGATPVCPTCTVQTAMCAGNYTVQVTDNLGCVRNATVAVSGPSVLSNTVAVTNPPCTVGQGTSVGSATVTASGGVAAYTFTWSPTPIPVGGVSPATTGGNMSAGTYTVFIRDANGCLDTAVVTLNPPTPVSGTITTITNPTCPNLNNGQLCVTASGGNGAYTYTWMPTGGNASCSATTLTVTAGGSSVYTVTIRDAFSCTVAVTGTLTAPPQATVTAAQTNPTCGSNPCTASATLTPNGGTGPFNYAWSCSASTTSTISNQCPNTSCTYTVTDVGTNCRYTGTVSFGPVPPTLTVSISATALNCAGDCNSVITSTVNGGTSGYTYSWTGTGTNPVCATCPSQINMCAGNYTLQVTDNLGCQQTATLSITTPPALTLTLAPTQPSCSASCDGSILATISGGTAPYPCVNWSPNVVPPNTLNPTGLCGLPSPGQTYTLIICDNNGCQDTATATLIAPPTLNILSVNVDSVACTGLCNGTATATVSGGTAPYQYSWDNGAFVSSATVSALCAGSHTLVVRDTNNCIATTQIFNVFEPNPISATVDSIQNTCGPCSGSAAANPTGGTPPYTYTWSPTGGNSASADSLCIGNYTLTVGDANGCPTTSVAFTISPIVVISLSVNSQSVSCNNACDGVATAVASSGSAPYNMVWTASPSGTVMTTCTTVATCSVGGLCPGTYVITATDQNGCVNRDSVVIGNPPLLTATDNVTNSTCFGGCSGSATVTPAAGTAPYTVNWSHGPTGTTVSNLCPGPYTYTVIDNRGCTVIQSFTVTSSTQFTVTSTTTAPVACAGANGTIEVTATGGSPVYTFSWNPGGTVTTVSPSSTITAIPAGVYSVTITDALGCDTTVQITLSDPGSPTVTATSQSVSCNGVCDGSATVTAVGTPIIAVTWPVGPVTGASPLSVSAQCAGTYAVQATDGNGCNAFQNITITGPAPITDGIPTIVQPNCSTGGSITVSPGGGSGAGYTFCWDPSPGCAQTGNPATGLSAGVHTLVITDGSGCSATFNYTLTTTSSPTVTVTSFNTNCSYTSDGSANATVTGGTPAYTYTWTNSLGVVASGTNLTNVNNLPADSYTLAVTDAGGCTGVQTFTIANPSVIVPNFGKNDNLCNAGCTGTATVNPTGGTGAFTINWIPGSFTTTTVSALCPQNYTVIVTDANNCQDTTSFTITAPPTLTVTTAGTDPLCNGGNNGTGTVTIGGGTPGYTITWNPNICSNCTTVINLNAGSYAATVTDTNGCSATSILVINDPTAISSISSVTSPLCTGNCNGSIAVSTFGGNGPYTYTWSPGVTVFTNTDSTNNSGLCAANSPFTLITNDANGCADTTAYTLPDATQLTANASSTPASCGQTNGSIIITGVTGTGTITVNWLTPATCGSSLNCNNLGFGVYNFEIIDQNGCRDTFNVAVNNPNGPEIDSVVVHNLCNGGSSGSITVNVVNPVFSSPYIFTWTPNIFTATTTSASSTYSGLPAGGPYISTVVDSLGCGTATTFTITQPSPIQDNGNTINATCIGINDGAINIIATGGTPGTTGTGYTFTLNGTSTNTTGSFTGLAVGVHTVCVTDSTACQQCFIYTINPNIVISSQISSAGINCNGDCNGSATLSNVNGGAAPYTIVWSGGQTTPIISGLCVGSYTATITDTNGCQAVDTISLSAPSPISPNQVVVLPGCGQCNGSINIAPSGGTPGVTTPYTYTWNTGATGTSINAICAGIFQVDITDSLGCMQSFQVGVSNDSGAVLSVIATSPQCSNQCTGSATVTPVGGTPPFTYSWPSVPSSSSSISNQCAGTYFVQVQDSLGCISTNSVQILQNNVITLNTTMTNPPCGVCSGTIIASAGGGAGPYTYSWSTGSTNDTLTAMCAGAYTLVVTDSTTGCTDTNLVLLNSNANGPTLTMTSTDVLCNGSCSGTATVVASNGTPNYTYQWSNGLTTDTISGLCPNTYNVLVTDSMGCIQNGVVVVSQPNPLIASLPTVSQPSCFNDCNGSITTVVSGGTPLYTYTWSPSSVTGTGGNGLCPGNYSVTITDANGCTVTEFDTLVNPAQLVITGTVVPASCNTASDGAINTSTTGGTPSLSAPGYTWQWSGGSTAITPGLSNIPIGTYTVVVTDSRNCTDTANFTMISTSTVTVNAGTDTTACGIDTLVLNGVVNAGTTVLWIQLPNPPGPILGATPSITLTSVAIGTTQYVLIGQNGACSLSDTISVTSNPLPTPDAGLAGSIFNGFSYNIGGSPTNPSGGTVVWSPGGTLSDSTVANPVATPSTTTTYTVYETNSSGCVAFDTVTVIILPNFVIPNGFSPNGDGWNDTWQIDNIQLFPDCEVEVFNRWGEPLFYSKGYTIPWNGTYKGKHVPIGTYYYLIRLNEKEGKFPDYFTGPLTILR